MSTQNVVSSDFLRVLLTLKQNVMRDTHVATFGIVKEILADTCMVTPFPALKNENEKQIEVTRLGDISVSVKDVVVVVFTDRNTIQNLRQHKLNQVLTRLENDASLHSDKYGVIIGKLSKTPLPEASIVDDGGNTALSYNGTNLLVSGTTLKTVGSISLLGNGNIAFKSVGGESVVGSGNITFKTLNGESLLGSGNIEIDMYVEPPMPEIRLTSFGAYENPSAGIDASNPFVVRVKIDKPEKLEVNDEFTICMKAMTSKKGDKRKYRLRQVLMKILTQNDIDDIIDNDGVFIAEFTDIINIKHYARNRFKTVWELDNAHSGIGYTTIYARIRRCSAPYSLETSDGFGRHSAIYTNVIPIRVYVGFVPDGINRTNKLFIRNGD